MTAPASDPAPALSLFTADPAEPGTLVPTPVARSMWTGGQMHGVAVSGALARGAEAAFRDHGRDDLRPARWTVDLFRPARTAPCRVSSEVVREGRRLCLVDVRLHQGDVVVARASALLLAPGATPSGRVWTPTTGPVAPSTDEVPPSDTPRVPFFDSGSGWSQDLSEHQNDARKSTWQTALPVVAGEPVSGFVAAASLADTASLLTNWGSEGVQFINTDITLTLARPPHGVEVGMVAVDRVEQDGIAVGSVTVLDRAGPLGTVVVTALANADRPVDLHRVEYSEDGRRTLRDPVS